MKSLAQSLGSVRDHDVAIITLKKTATEAPPEISDGILRLVELRHRARERAFAVLAPALESDGLSRLMTKFEEALHVAIKRPPRERGASRSRAPVAARMTYREVTTSTVLGHLKDLEERSQSLYRPSEANRCIRCELQRNAYDTRLNFSTNVGKGKQSPFQRS